MGEEQDDQIRSVTSSSYNFVFFLNTGSSAGDSDYLDPNFFPKSGIQSFTRADSIVKKALKNHD